MEVGGGQERPTMKSMNKYSIFMNEDVMMKSIVLCNYCLKEKNDFIYKNALQKSSEISFNKM